MHVLWLRISALGLMLTATPHAQTLRDMLWQRATPCYSRFEDTDEDGKVDATTMVDDAANGYLQLAGEWPTCGCGCSTTVGAFRQADGGYTLLQTEQWNCSWQKRISSNRPLPDVLPEGFGFVTFAPHAPPHADSLGPAFVLLLDIPRHGTDTRARVEPIPFGLVLEGDDALTMSYGEEQATCSRVWTVRTLAQNFSDPRSLEYLLAGTFEKMPADDRMQVDNQLGDGPGIMEARIELQRALARLKHVYELWQAMEFDTIVLGWDRKAARFFVKEKARSSRSMSFRDFLVQGVYWSPAC